MSSDLDTITNSNQSMTESTNYRNTNSANSIDSSNTENQNDDVTTASSYNKRSLYRTITENSENSTARSDFNTFQDEYPLTDMDSIYSSASLRSNSNTRSQRDMTDRSNDASTVYSNNTASTDSRNSVYGGGYDDDMMGSTNPVMSSNEILRQLDNINKRTQNIMNGGKKNEASSDHKSTSSSNTSAHRRSSANRNSLSRTSSANSTSRSNKSNSSSRRNNSRRNNYTTTEFSDFTESIEPTESTESEVEESDLFTVSG